MEIGDIIEVGGDDWEIKAAAGEGRLELRRVPSFREYLRQHVFVEGGYSIESGGYRSDARVAERDNGSGYIVEADMRRALEDGAVGVVSVKDGWLLLEDQR